MSVFLFLVKTTHDFSGSSLLSGIPQIIIRNKTVQVAQTMEDSVLLWSKLDLCPAVGYLITVDKKCRQKDSWQWQKCWKWKRCELNVYLFKHSKCY